MDFSELLNRILIILAASLMMAMPFVLIFLAFIRDKKNKNSHKRLRIAVYTLLYVIMVTVALYCMEDEILKIERLPFVQWIAYNFAAGNRAIYCCEVAAAVLVNSAVGFLHCISCAFVRIGLAEKNLTVPQKNNGEFSLMQRIERRIVGFFHTETWFMVGGILKCLSIVLSCTYTLIYIVFLIPAVFEAAWLPFSFVTMLFDAGYIYPAVTLLTLWEIAWFLKGVENLRDECPELLSDKSESCTAEVDFEAIDAEVRRQFNNYYLCDLKLPEAPSSRTTSANHCEITKLIGKAVENDNRIPGGNREVYLDCIDKMVETRNSILVNGCLFSGFSAYFFRYLSVIIARGDNVVFVCSSDSQIEPTYNYLTEGFSKLSSLYCKSAKTDVHGFDDPIWRIVRICGDYSSVDEASVDDSSILVTSLSYLCSARFESGHERFIHLLDTVVFTDTLKIVNMYNNQLAALNTRLKSLAKHNSLLSKNGNVNKDFSVRYMSKQVRYICFDDTRTPGLDKVLKNLLSVEFESADSMEYNAGNIVRCYTYEGRADENGRRICPQFFDSKEEIGVLMNVAVMCLAKGASNVTVFADDLIPYANIAETIAANMGRISIKSNGSNIRLNKPFYNSNDYSVIIAMDSGDNLLSALRKYMSMVADKPVIIYIFSRPYMLRDYYADNLSALWATSQIERIPIEIGTKKDIAQRILVKANAGGISENEVLQLASGISGFDKFVQKKDINAILREVLKMYGLSQVDLYDYFEYSSTRDFDENGIYTPEDKVSLRRKGKLYDIINGRNMAVLSINGKEVTLPLPKCRITQNHICGQNLLYNGDIYNITKIDTASGRIHVSFAAGGKNDETYRYIQAREYYIKLNSDKLDLVYPIKHVVLNRDDDDVSVNDIYLSIFRAPMEVLTRGYFEVDSHTLAVNSSGNVYHSIIDPGNDELAKQTYRRYGEVKSSVYSADSVIKSTDLLATENGAMVMSIKMNGQFGADVNKTAALSAVMLNELMRSMFPSVCDSVSVCPVLRGELSDDEARAILKMQPRVTVSGNHELLPECDFELVIIEDCAADLGVVSSLMSAGDDVLDTLFSPIYSYLEWYFAAKQKSSYLYYGLDREPSCFDFASLHKLSEILSDDRHDLKFVDITSIVEHEVCDFCGKRYSSGEDITRLDDGRKMCKECSCNIVSGDRRAFKYFFDGAKVFLERTYGIAIKGGYEFSYEPSVKIANTLRQNRGLISRGADIPLKSYVDSKKRAHIEHTIPCVSFSELIVRELTHIWQMEHLPKLSEELAEGHIALVTVKYLAFMNQNSLASARTTYYESTDNLSGMGYRKLIRALSDNPQFEDNPFSYLLEHPETDAKNIAGLQSL